MGQFQMKIVPTWGDLKVEYRRALIGELISEALAVAIIILIGDGAAAMITLYDPSPYAQAYCCLLYTSPSPRDRTRSRMPSSA